MSVVVILDASRSRDGDFAHVPGTRHAPQSMSGVSNRVEFRRTSSHSETKRSAVDQGPGPNPYRQAQSKSSQATKLRTVEYFPNVVNGPTPTSYLIVLEESRFKYVLHKQYSHRSVRVVWCSESIDFYVCSKEQLPVHHTTSESDEYCG